MKAIIDGKVIEAKHIEILDEIDDGKETIAIRQFANGTQGVLKTVEIVRRVIHKACVDNFPQWRCCTFPVIKRTYNWIWYGGLRLEVKKNDWDKIPVWMTELPCKTTLTDWRRKHEDEIAEAMREHGWSVEEEQ